MKTLAPDNTGSLGRLEQLLTREDIWRGQAGLRLDGQGLPTGFAQLDSQLSHGGWPVNG
jgi:protein ImuA